MDKKRNSVEFKITGRYAMFADPVTRVGGEKFSYQIPTYQALKGILESVYWKPTLIWYIDAVRVMEKIQTESKGIKPIKMSGGNDLAYYTYLRDVEYQVLAHFEWNEHRNDLDGDRDENKHHNIAKRCIIKGGRRDIFLGTRECQGYVEPCMFGEGESFYKNYGELDFGIQFHGYDYPDETGKDELFVRLWRPKMKDGLIEFPMPKNCDPALRRFIRKMTAKEFEKDRNFSLLGNDQSLMDLLSEE
ncbi:MAG: type I-C CRISPR-associated protein Cas5c [Proteobacteria bacterium]|nr:type I-C CRISPR-associated protein Cas5 [Desulfocapsa sp.]MBU3946120.1 type I-C CRISPR-associated protein Cas5c [Pseudomonadota bacterium]MCG2742355.1 type I-C CRISPR-associated protein Cas5c [Desulfobacteraceae bacterium]MBU3982362.1 type I-C CRISPR-associated protein Cas5c [Pseudomonadota bacterium]MBU4027323.1 type I-C CRISPR-associated protein Cas5c [Pseudomonadota bacterium]